MHKLNFKLQGLMGLDKAAHLAERINDLPDNAKQNRKRKSEFQYSEEVYLLNSRKMLN